MRQRNAGLALAAALVAAAALRVAGIDHHLLHDAMDFDEMNNFVEPMQKMMRTGSPNPTVYSGYPGFFNWLAFVPAAVGRRLAGSYGAYVGARLVVATFGVLNVALVYLLCRRWTVARGPALFAAALMAVSQGHVRAAHHVIPDVVVTSGVLGMLLVLAKADTPRAWAAAGALCGLATAVKYTGLLGAPGLVIGLVSAPERKRSVPVAVGAALVAFALAAPYALVATGSMGMGFDHSVAHYYGGADANRALQGKGLALARVLGYLVADAGTPALLLAAAAFVLCRPRRTLAPALTVILAAIVVTAPANKVYARHVLPATAAVIVLAGAGLAGALGRFRSPAARAAFAVAAAGFGLGPPAAGATRLALVYRGPTSADSAVEWVESRLPSGALIASAVEPFAPDPGRIEVRGFATLEDLPAEARRQYDLVVFKGIAPRRLPDLEIVREFCSGPKPSGCELTFLRARDVPSLLRRPRPDRTLASEGSDAPEAAWDGDATTAWRAPSGSGWIAARWEQPTRVVRVELDADSREASWPQTLSWEGVLADGGHQSLLAFGLRPGRVRRQRPGAPHGDVFVFTPPARVRELRLVRGEGGPWGVAELRVFDELP